MTANALTLWHASDDPNIQIFHPHRAPTAQVDDDLVWAIDEAHVPAYWFPRDCPRATFWIGPNTTLGDAAWLNGAARVHAIEWAWWERFRVARVYLYLMPPATFAVHNAEAATTSRASRSRRSRASRSTTSRASTRRRASSSA